MKVHVVNAFVDGDRGGNPAGVVLDADALSHEQMQSIAAKVGLSETAFLRKSAKATFQTLFFTPTRQIADCGHATVGAFALLAQEGRLPAGRLSKETIEGVREIALEGDQIFMQLGNPTLRPCKVPGAALESLGIAPEALVSGLQLAVVDVGVRFIVAPLRETATLAALKPNFEKIRQVSDAEDLIGYYVYVPAASQPGRVATARMFAPRYGIDEESATGMGAGTLAAYLALGPKLPGDTFLIEQGFYMPTPSPSLITATLKRDGARITELRVGGRGRVARTLEISV